MRRIISALLCMCLIMTSVCVTVFADETTSEIVPTTYDHGTTWSGDRETVGDDLKVTGNGSGDKYIRYVHSNIFDNIGTKPFEISIEFTADTYAAAHNGVPYIQARNGKYYLGSDTTGNAAFGLNTELKQGQTYKLNIAVTKDLKFSAELNGAVINDKFTLNESSTSGNPWLLFAMYQPTDATVADVITFKKPVVTTYPETYSYAYNGKLANAPQKLTGTYNAELQARNGNVLVNGASKSSAYPAELSYKTTEENVQPSFFFNSPNTNSQYTSGTEGIKWLRLSVNITDKKGLGNLNIAGNANSGTRRSVGTLNNGGSYQIDVIHNLETGDVVTYNNYVKVTTSNIPLDTANNKYFMITGGRLNFTENESFAVVNSAKFMEYTASQTLEDFQAEMDDSAKKGSRTITLVPSNRGGSSVAANSDGSYDVTVTPSAIGGQTSQYIAFGENIPFYTEETKNNVNIPFARLHAEIKYDNYNGGYFQFTPLYKYTVEENNKLTTKEQKGSYAGQISVSDNKTHSFDVIFDMMAKQMYIYLDGVLAYNLDTGSGLTSGMINNLVLFETTQQAANGKFNIKNTNLTLYYDREPVVSTIDELCNLVKSDNTVALSGAFRYYNADKNVYALATGYAGFDRNAHMGIIAEYDENNNLIRALSLINNNQYLTEDGSAKTIRVFIWDKTTLEPLADSVSAYIPE